MRSCAIVRGQNCVQYVSSTRQPPAAAALEISVAASCFASYNAIRSIAEWTAVQREKAACNAQV
jgi:hypothetical protein